MPTVLRDGPYRLYWVSQEPDEPPHVHVDRGECSAKFRGVVQKTIVGTMG